MHRFAEIVSIRLREPRVRHIIEPMMAGRTLGDVPADDRQYVVDLGLVRRDPTGGLVVANPIYREVIPGGPLRRQESGNAPIRSRISDCGMSGR